MVNQAQNSEPIRPKQKQLIHILTHQLHMSRDEYELMIAGYRGAASSSQLTATEADQVIDDLLKKGAVITGKPKPAFSRRSRGAAGNNRGTGRSEAKDKVVHLVTAGEKEKIKAIAALVQWQLEDGYERWLKARFKLADVRTSGEAYRVIEGLKKMLDNQMKKAHGAGWWTIRFDDPEIEKYISLHAPAEFRNALGQVLKR